MQNTLPERLFSRSPEPLSITPVEDIIERVEHTPPLHHQTNYNNPAPHTIISDNELRNLANGIKKAAIQGVELKLTIGTFQRRKQ